MEAEFNDVSGGVSLGRLEQVEHGCVDVATILGDFVHTWTGDQPTLGTRMSCADRFVVRVEEVSKPLVVGLVSRNMRTEHEFLKEPGRVGTMPFRGTHVRHRL